MLKFFENLLSFFEALWASENGSWGALVLQLGTLEALGLQDGALARLWASNLESWSALGFQLGVLGKL